VLNLFFEEFSAFWDTEIATGDSAWVQGYKIYSTAQFTFCLLPYASYSDLINEYWVRPHEKYKPKNAEKVEGACYW
jgi:hypothetical protein